MRKKEKYMIKRSQYDVVVFDLDGVITKTQKTHAKAWKKTFDEFLKKRTGGDTFTPFNISKDYLDYVDGKPREEGIRSFLASRNIKLVEGRSDDAKDIESVAALANMKNSYFLELVSQGVKTYKSSSSKNCTYILQSANLSSYFNTVVDGLDLQSLDLKGKPEPDLFLEALKRLDVEPSRAIVIEDAIAGVAAGKKGAFGKVIGVDRNRHSKQLMKAGADLVVKDLAELDIETKTTELPSALQSFKKIESRFKDKEVVLFLDYDGTLTPIVSHPKDVSSDKRQGIE